MPRSPLRDLDSEFEFRFQSFGVKAVRLQPECLPKSRMKQAEREPEEFGFGDSAINVWVRDADCALFHCLTGADRTIDRPRAPDRA
jgi:hypothetical protein